MMDNISKRKVKKQRIEISNIDDFKKALIREGYKVDETDNKNISEIFKVDITVVDEIYNRIEKGEIIYRADDVRDFIDYIEKILTLEEEHKKLWDKMSKIKKLNIHRIEYEREVCIKDNVDDVVKAIEEVKNYISIERSEEEQRRLEELEKEISKEYLYAKDIELLKKMSITLENMVEEKYDPETKIKTVSIELPKEISYKYIKSNWGMVEYHQQLTNIIPRIQRLTKNLDKYLECDEKELGSYNINQSEALQDSINIALATFDNREYKAISGGNNIINYCVAPTVEDVVFKSSKVNKLGKLGVGYNRVNDSEKKIFEQIHKEIERKLIKSEGDLVLYSKWEPCPSCYYVISQFCEKHPRINVKIKYSKKYGEH